MAIGISPYSAVVEDIIFTAIFPHQLASWQRNELISKTGVYRLHFAVLMDVVVQLLAQKRLPEDEMDWVRSRDKSHLFSFENVCVALGLDASAVRCRLLEMDQAIRTSTQDNSAPRRGMIRRYHIMNGRSRARLLSRRAGTRRS